MKILNFLGLCMVAGFGAKYGVELAKSILAYQVIFWEWVIEKFVK